MKNANDYTTVRMKITTRDRVNEYADNAGIKRAVVWDQVVQEGLRTLERVREEFEEFKAKRITNPIADIKITEYL